MIGEMNRKQVVLIGPLYCISHQNQRTFVFRGQCCWDRQTLMLNTYIALEVNSDITEFKKGCVPQKCLEFDCLQLGMYYWMQANSKIRFTK